MCAWICIDCGNGTIVKEVTVCGLLQSIKTLELGLEGEREWRSSTPTNSLVSKWAGFLRVISGVGDKAMCCECLERALWENLCDPLWIKAERTRRPQHMVYYKAEDKTCGLGLKDKKISCLIFCPQSLSIFRAGPSNFN